jgi:hypothetical protein
MWKWAEGTWEPQLAGERAGRVWARGRVWSSRSHDSRPQGRGEFLVGGGREPWCSGRDGFPVVMWKDTLTGPGPGPRAWCQ